MSFASKHFRERVGVVVKHVDFEAELNPSVNEKKRKKISSF